MPELSTTGGTSDGRFIADICNQVIEFGPLNATIHKLNECVGVADIEPLKETYKLTLEKLLGFQKRLFRHGHILQWQVCMSCM